MDHAELVAEFPYIEQLSVLKRLELARKRRTLQVVKFHEYLQLYEQEGKSRHPEDRVRRLKFPSAITLFDSTVRGDAEEVRQLLNAGVDPNSRKEDGLTSLHQCCIDDNEEILRLLLSRGASVNACDTELWTPLHAAACCGHLNIAQILVANGANLLAVNADGNMPYDICDDENTLDYLESEMAHRGVTQEQIDYLRAAPERQMLADMQNRRKLGEDLEATDQNGATPLHIASANGYASVAEFLLDCGCSVDPMDKDSWQPIHAAACWAQPHIIEILVNYGADINAMTNSGETALDLCDEPEVRDVILDLDRKQMHFQRINSSFSRGSSIRLSKRKKPSSKFESPQYTSAASLEGTSSHSRAIRRFSLRDKAGATIARLEAKQEALIRSQSMDDATFPAPDGSDASTPTTSDEQKMTDADLHNESPKSARKAMKKAQQQAGVNGSSAPAHYAYSELPGVNQGGEMGDRPDGARGGPQALRPGHRPWDNSEDTPQNGYVSDYEEGPIAVTSVSIAKSKHRRHQPQSPPGSTDSASRNRERAPKSDNNNNDSSGFDVNGAGESSNPNNVNTTENGNSASSSPSNGGPSVDNLNRRYQLPTITVGQSGPASPAMSARNRGNNRSTVGTNSKNPSPPSGHDRDVEVRAAGTVRLAGEGSRSKGGSSINNSKNDSSSESQNNSMSSTTNSSSANPRPSSGKPNSTQITINNKTVGGDESGSRIVANSSTINSHQLQPAVSGFSTTSNEFGSNGGSKLKNLSNARNGPLMDAPARNPNFGQSEFKVAGPGGVEMVEIANDGSGFGKFDGDNGRTVVMRGSGRPGGTNTKKANNLHQPPSHSVGFKKGFSNSSDNAVSHADVFILPTNRDEDRNGGMTGGNLSVTRPGGARHESPIKSFKAPQGQLVGGGMEESGAPSARSKGCCCIV